MKILTYPEIDAIKWEQLSVESAVTSYFQTKSCYEFYSTLSFLQPFVWAVEENGLLVCLVCGYTIANGGIIKQFFSRRAIIPGGLLLSNNCSNEAITLLLEHVKSELYKKAIYIEIRNLNEYSQWKLGFQQAGFKYNIHYNVKNCLKNKSLDTLLNSFAHEKQRQLKSANINGLKCDLLQDINELKLFYKLLSDLYNKNLHLPLFPFEFFEKLHKQKNADILIVKEKTKIIGGIVLVHDHQTSYEWFVCGDKKNKNYPSVVATAAGLQLAKNKGLHTFDFMGAGDKNKTLGIRNFKLRFGGQLVEQGRYLNECHPKLYILGKKTIQLVTNNI